jgi:two-component system chemotaxis response regulator CheB
VYLARGGLHLLVRPGHVHVRPGPRENGHRPAVDPLFRSAANYYDGRAIGVILSGSQSDGTAGLFAIRSRAGLAVVQDPADALYDGMPSSALEYVGVDHVVPAADMGELLTRLVESSPDRDRPEQPFAPHLHREVRFMEGDLEALENDHPGEPSPWPCPDCNGVLWQIEDGPILRFRCRIGHAWAADTLLQQQGDGVEEALWMALRALEDRVALSQKLAARAEEGGRRLSALRYREDLAAMERSVDVLRQLLTTRRTGSEELNEGGNPGG